MKPSLLMLVALALFSCSKETKDTRIDLIDNFVAGQAEHFKFNGSVLVAEKGKVIYQKCFGLSNYDTNTPLNDSTRFELASVSKQFTAAAIMVLKKQGKIQLTDSLRMFFPELPYTGISVHHLLTHTSGLPDYFDTMMGKWDESKIAYNNDIIQFLAKEKPSSHFKPGAKWEYSNTGYVMLASIVEKVSGQTFKDFMSQQIFAPLKMKNSRVYNTRRSGETLSNYANGYTWSDSLKKFVLPDSVSDLKFVYWLDGLQGDGIINSTAADLLKWDRAIVNHTLLSEDEVKAMTGNHALSDTTSKYYYGYGMIVGENQFGKFVTHSGGWPGYATNLSRYVDQDYTIIVLSNNESASTAISGSIAHIVFNNSVLLPYTHKPVTLDTATLDTFTGTFKIKNQEITFARDKDELFRVYGPQRRVKFLPESDSRIYTTEEFDVQYEVEPGENGKNKYYRIMYGVKEEMEKVK